MNNTVEVAATPPRDNKEPTNCADVIYREPGTDMIIGATFEDLVIFQS